MSRWGKGYAISRRPDLNTCALQWLNNTALVLADLTWEDGAPVAPSPRAILRRQVERARQWAWTP